MYRTLLPNTGYNTLFTSHNWVHTKKVLMQRGRQVSRWRLSSNQIKYALHPPPFRFWRPPSPHRSRTSSLKIMLQATLSYYSEQGRLIGLIRRRLDEDHKWAMAVFHSKVPVLSEKRERIQEIQYVWSFLICPMNKQRLVLFSSSISLRKKFQLTAQDKDNSVTGVGVHREQCLSSNR